MAGEHFARAVVILGISTIQAVLLRGQGRTVVAQVLRRSTPPRACRRRLQGKRAPDFAAAQPSGRDSGEASPYGFIRVARNQSMTEQRLTLLHELVHRYLSPRTGPFQIRAELRMSAYARSSLLQYLEEAMAEGYAQLRVNGLAQAVQALRFPLNGGYVTSRSSPARDGDRDHHARGEHAHVTISLGPIPDDNP